MIKNILEVVIVCGIIYSIIFGSAVLANRYDLFKIEQTSPIERIVIQACDELSPEGRCCAECHVENNGMIAHCAFCVVGGSK